MKLKTTLCLVSSLAISATSFAFAAGEGWITDFEKAKTQAAEENKSILLEFTGSDWCPPCKQMAANFFSKKDWVDQASKDFILVELDFPNNKEGMSDELQAQNETLSEQYGISGFPTIVLTDSEGSPYSMKVGGFNGSIDEHIGMLRDEKNNGAKFQTSMAAAKKLEGDAKAAKLVESFEMVDLDLVKAYYGTELQELAKLQPDNPLSRSVNMEKNLEELQNSLMPLMAGQKFDEINEAVDKFIAEKMPEGEMLQKTKLFKVMGAMEQEQFDVAVKSIEEIITIDPSSETSAMLKQAVEQIKMMANQPKPDEADDK